MDTSGNIRFLKEGESQYQNEIQLTDEEAKDLSSRPIKWRKNWMRNKPCICGSDEKMKKCCWNKLTVLNNPHTLKPDTVVKMLDSEFIRFVEITQDEQWDHFKFGKGGPWHYLVMRTQIYSTILDPIILRMFDNFEDEEKEILLFGHFYEFGLLDKERRLQRTTEFIEALGVMKKYITK